MTFFGGKVMSVLSVVVRAMGDVPGGTRGTRGRHEGPSPPPDPRDEDASPPPPPLTTHASTRAPLALLIPHGSWIPIATQRPPAPIFHLTHAEAPYRDGADTSVRKTGDGSSCGGDDSPGSDWTVNFNLAEMSLREAIVARRMATYEDRLRRGSAPIPTTPVRASPPGSQGVQPGPLARSLPTPNLPFCTFTFPTTPQKVVEEPLPAFPYCESMLPDDAVLQVFTFLETRDLRNVACVCQRWRRITQDPLLWRQVFYRIFERNCWDPPEMLASRRAYEAHHAALVAAVSTVGLDEADLNWPAWGQWKELYDLFVASLTPRELALGDILQFGQSLLQVEIVHGLYAPLFKVTQHKICDTPSPLPPLPSRGDEEDDGDEDSSPYSAECQSQLVCGRVYLTGMSERSLLDLSHIAVQLENGEDASAMEDLRSIMFPQQILLPEWEKPLSTVANDHRDINRAISRQHAEIVFYNCGFHLRDFSKYGSYIYRHRRRRGKQDDTPGALPYGVDTNIELLTVRNFPLRLRPGDIIQLGLETRDSLSWLFGVGGRPSPDFGIDGQFFFELRTGDVFLKSRGVWSLKFECPSICLLEVRSITLVEGKQELEFFLLHQGHSLLNGIPITINVGPRGTAIGRQAEMMYFRDDPTVHSVHARVIKDNSRLLIEPFAPVHTFRRRVPPLQKEGEGEGEGEGDGGTKAEG